MKPRLVTLLDLGLDEDFDASMSFVQGLLKNVNAGFTHPILNVDFVRSRDTWTIDGAMRSRCSVLHVMSHGDHEEGPTFSSSDEETEVNLESIADTMIEEGYGIKAGAILADGCKTGIGVWKRAIRDCIEDPVTYIGTTRKIGWHEPTVFGGAFYGALLRNRGRGSTPAEQTFDAAERAIKAYEILTDTTCPFTVTTLEPSKRAIRAFQSG